MARILMVDDDPDVVRVVVAALAGRGHDVMTARDGASALELAGAHAIDLAIVDRNLPRIDGAEVCRRLRNGDVRRIPVVMLSSTPIDLDETQRPDGANAFIMRPFLRDMLVNNVERLLAEATAAARG